MQVRSDLVGVVWVNVDGELKSLAAGDTIPDGVTVGDHITGPDESGPAKAASEADRAPEPDGKPRGNASAEAWHDYAKSQGATDKELDGLTRDEIRNIYQ